MHEPGLGVELAPEHRRSDMGISSSILTIKPKPITCARIFVVVAIIVVVVLLFLDLIYLKGTVAEIKRP